MSGPAHSHIRLVSSLATCLPEPYRILYVLVVSRSIAANAARYESANELSRQGLGDFLAEFSEFFESDGRHHLWVANLQGGTIVYDRHNLIYAYGPLDRFVEIAEAQGLHNGSVEIPVPHWHAYHADCDATQRRLLARWDWVESPLLTRDEG